MRGLKFQSTFWKILRPGPRINKVRPLIIWKSLIKREKQLTAIRYSVINKEKANIKQ